MTYEINGWLEKGIVVNEFIQHLDYMASGVGVGYVRSGPQCTRRRVPRRSDIGIVMSLSGRILVRRPSVRAFVDGLEWVNNTDACVDEWCGIPGCDGKFVAPSNRGNERIEVS